MLVLFFSHELPYTLRTKSHVRLAKERPSREVNKSKLQHITPPVQHTRRHVIVAANCRANQLASPMISSAGFLLPKRSISFGHTYTVPRNTRQQFSTASMKVYEELLQTLHDATHQPRVMIRTYSNWQELTPCDTFLPKSTRSKAKALAKTVYAIKVG